MPSVLFAGGRLDSLAITGGPTEITTAGRFDPTYCDCAIFLNSTANSVAAVLRDSSSNPTDLTAGQTGYFHCEMLLISTSATVTNIFTLEDSAGYPWFAVRNVAANTWGLYYNSGTGPAPVWTLIGATFAASAPLTQHDIKITLGSPHVVEYSAGSTLVASGSFTQAAFTGVRQFRVSHPIQATVSQILVTEGRSAIGGKVKYSRATGAGANSGWTGAYTDVNEAINSDATVNAAAAAGLRQTYPMGDVAVPAGYAIVSVFYAIRAKNDGAAPANIKASIRSGAANFDAAANFPGIGTSFGSLVARYDNDPNTAAPWTQAGWNAVEAGYLSAA